VEILTRTNLRLLSLAIVKARGLVRETRAAGVETPGLQEEPRVRIALPPPDLLGQLPLEQALARRRSLREFSPEPLSQNELSQLLWAAQGITDIEGRRTAPSAGALYPLEVYVSIASGVYRYNPRAHELELHSENDLRATLYWAAQCRGVVRDAPAVFVISGEYDRIERKYGHERSSLYAHLEAGHAAQNLLLQAVTLGLGGVPIGGFYDDQVGNVLFLPGGYQPLYLIAIGRPK
jgi:SagB-type dehydrogenase family enzyme